MKKQIIIINGTGECGKDSFVKCVQKYEKTFNFSSIDGVRRVAREAGWDGGKTEKDRKFLCDLKKLTTEYNDFAFNYITKAVKEFRESDNSIMFIHIREPEEIERAVKAFDAKSLLIKRKGQENIKSNPSDANVDNYDYDFIVHNDGTLEELEVKAKDFVEKLNKE